MLRAGVRLFCALATFGLCSASSFAEPTDPTADPIGARVRGATPRMARLIEDATRRSSTFASLVTALNRTDVIVYVQETKDLPSGVDGQLAVTTSRGGQRYLRAQVISGLGLKETISIVGHELQHAIEVAEHGEVRDSHSLAALYRTIGLEAPRGRFDTAAARTIGKRVRAELG